MAGKTKIGGTAYDISGGNATIGGTKYAISKGKTRIEGTAHEISFRKPVYHWTISRAGSTSTDTTYASAYISINGTPYYTLTSGELNVGDTIKVYAKSGQVTRGHTQFTERVGVKLNGRSAGSVTSASNFSSYSLIYSYTPTFTSDDMAIKVSLLHNRPTSTRTSYVEITQS